MTCALVGGRLIVKVKALLRVASRFRGSRRWTCRGCMVVLGPLLPPWSALHPGVVLSTGRRRGDLVGILVWAFISITDSSSARSGLHLAKDLFCK